MGITEFKQAFIVYISTIIHSETYCRFMRLSLLLTGTVSSMPHHPRLVSLLTVTLMSYFIMAITSITDILMSMATPFELQM